MKIWAVIQGQYGMPGARRAYCTLQEAQAAVLRMEENDLPLNRPAIVELELVGTTLVARAGSALN